MKKIDKSPLRTLTLHTQTLRILSLQQATGGKELVSIPVNNCVSKIPWNCPQPPPTTSAICF